jgi:hypothetical protein
MDQKLAVWASMTNAEKDANHAILWKARVAWLKTHPPAERVNEEVWPRMQHAFGDLR